MVKKKPSKLAALKSAPKTLDDVAGENQEIAKFNRLKSNMQLEHSSWLTVASVSRAALNLESPQLRAIASTELGRLSLKEMRSELWWETQSVAQRIQLLANIERYADNEAELDLLAEKFKSVFRDRPTEVEEFQREKRIIEMYVAECLPVRELATSA